MRRRQYKVLGVGHKRLLFAGVVAPKQKHHGVLPLVQIGDHRIGKDLPSFPLMGVGLSAADGQNRVQKQHPVFRPLFQTAMRWGDKSDIIGKLLIDIFQ